MMTRFRGYLQPFGLDWLDGVDDERRGDFVKLPRTDLRKEVAFKQALSSLYETMRPRFKSHQMRKASRKT